MIKTYNDYIEEPLCITLEESQKIHSEIISEIGSNEEAMEIYRIEVMPLGTNCYLVYDGDTKLYSTDKLDGTEYDNDGESHSYTFSGVGRGLKGNVYGLSKSGSTISITNNLTITDNYKKSPYDPYTYPNAPRFEAYFSNPIFNKYLTRVDLYTYRVDETGLEAAMEEYRIEDLVLNYGIDFGTSKGIMGAADYMQTETYHYGLIL